MQQLQEVHNQGRLKVKLHEPGIQAQGSYIQDDAYPTSVVPSLSFKLAGTFPAMLLHALGATSSKS